MKAHQVKKNERLEEFFLYTRFESSAGSCSKEIDNKFDLIEKNILQALMHLPANLRLLILLCDVKEYSYEQMAVLTRQSVESITENINLARKMLEKSVWTQICLSNPKFLEVK